MTDDPSGGGGTEGGGTEGGGGRGWSPERSAAGDRNPWVVAAVISIAAFMEVLDIAIANVSLQHIAGSVSASYDEATWVLTSYLVSNAIVIPMSGWLSEVLGRKNYYMLSVACFSLASLFCGLAPSLAFLVLARVVQGMAGGGLQPMTQTMLVDSFPPQKRGRALAVFGLTVILAPTIGPVLGGFITDQYSWRWVFLINVPVGLLSLALVQVLVTEPELLRRERRERRRRGIRLDLAGAALIAIGLGFLEVTMDRGERDDWFSSELIRTTAVIATLGLLGFVVREWLAREPLLDLKLFAHRNFAVATLVIAVVGVVMFGTTQFLPQLLQQVLGYTATDAGLALTAGGVGTLIAMGAVGALSGRVQPRYLIAFGLAATVLGLWHMTHLNAQMSFAQAAWARLWQVIGIPFMFIPLTDAAYVGLPRERTGQATAIMNVMRNLGGSIGISMVQTLLADRQQFYQSRFTETLHALNPIYVNGIERIQQTLIALGQSATQAGPLAVAELYRVVQLQSSMRAFLDCFWVLMMVGAIVSPTVLLLRRSEHGGEG
ncbi:MAG TPA: DHA2 family efflux MFS transporter permease subunit [Steroidobacteraceae bacterium]|nr:DHA2 family efflux MFS transporter permease subunit [Steroidobacteraceae bacterium]